MKKECQWSHILNFSMETLLGSQPVENQKSKFPFKDL